MASGFPGEGRRHGLKAPAGTAIAATVPGAWAMAAATGMPAAPRSCPTRAQAKPQHGLCKSGDALREPLESDGFGQPKKIYEPTGALSRRGDSDTGIGLVPGGNFRRLRGDVLG